MQQRTRSTKSRLAPRPAPKTKQTSPGSQTWGVDCPLGHAPALTLMNLSLIQDREMTLRVREALVLVLNAPQATIVEFKRYQCPDSRSTSAPLMKYDAPTLLSYKQHCKEPPLYVWESLEAAGELRWCVNSSPLHGYQKLSPAAWPSEPYFVLWRVLWCSQAIFAPGSPSLVASFFFFLELELGLGLTAEAI